MAKDGSKQQETKTTKKNDEKIIEQAAEQTLNAKAGKFRTFLQDNDIKAFEVAPLEDDFHSVVFNSHILAEGQSLPVSVVIDDTAFVMFRVRVATGLGADKRAKMLEFVNSVNQHYKIYKYYLVDDGNLVLDICLPVTDESFDGRMVQAILDLLVNYLTSSYKKIMQQVWSED